MKCDTTHHPLLCTCQETTLSSAHALQPDPDHFLNCFPLTLDSRMMNIILELDPLHTPMCLLHARNNWLAQLRWCVTTRDCFDESHSCQSYDIVGESLSDSGSVAITPGTMKFIVSILIVIVSTCVQCHEYYSGQCPVFPPMSDLDWSRLVSSGEWWTAFKMNSRSSCIRYSYSGDTRAVGRMVRERKLLPVLGRFGVPSGVTSNGLISGRPRLIKADIENNEIRILRIW